MTIVGTVIPIVLISIIALLASLDDFVAAVILRLAAGVTTISGHKVTIIAAFKALALAVPTKGKLTIVGTGVVIGKVAIIAGLTRVQFSVAAKIYGAPTLIVATIVGNAIAIITILLALNNTVPTTLLETLRRTAITVDEIAVIALLGRLTGSIPTAGLSRTLGRTTITARQVSIIALFGNIELTIAAVLLERASLIASRSAQPRLTAFTTRLKHTISAILHFAGHAATIVGATIAVITFLVRILPTIPADHRDAQPLDAASSRTTSPAVWYICT